MSNPLDSGCYRKSIEGFGNWSIDLSLSPGLSSSSSSTGLALRGTIIRELSEPSGTQKLKKSLKGDLERRSKVANSHKRYSLKRRILLKKGTTPNSYTSWSSRRSCLRRGCTWRRGESVSEREWGWYRIYGWNFFSCGIICIPFFPELAEFVLFG